MHDLGAHYPQCTGHRNGSDAMEVEESANMVIMMAAYVKVTKDNEFAKKHYKIAKQWTDYLVEHGLITGIITHDQESSTLEGVRDVMFYLVLTNA